MSISYFVEPWDEYGYIVPTPNTIDMGLRWDVPLGSLNTRVAGPTGGFACAWNLTSSAVKVLGISATGWNVTFPIFWNGNNCTIQWNTGPAVNGTALNCGFSLAGNGYFGFYTGGLGGPLSGISTKPLDYKKWHFLEFYCGGFWTCGTGTPAGVYRICMDGEIIFANAGGEITASPYIFPALPNTCSCPSPESNDCVTYQGYVDRLRLDFGGGGNTTTGQINVWNGDACASGEWIQFAQTKVPTNVVCQES